MIVRSAHLQVYKERIHKRMVGDATAAESQSMLQQWIQEEATTDSHSGESDSFTRVTISNLKPGILKQFTVEEGANVCRQLAHMYHYYLHGAKGRTAEGAGMCIFSVLFVCFTICRVW